VLVLLPPTDCHGAGRGPEWRFIDVLPAAAGKGSAMRYVQQVLGYDDSSTVAAGDANNDLLMLQQVWSMQHQPTAVQHATKPVTLCGAAQGPSRQICSRHLVHVLILHRPCAVPKSAWLCSAACPVGLSASCLTARIATHGHDQVTAKT